MARANRDINALAGCIVENYRKTASLPEPDSITLGALWSAQYADDPFPTDPFGGGNYHYLPVTDTTFWVWSTGPDLSEDTDDDISIYFQANTTE